MLHILRLISSLTPQTPHERLARLNRQRNIKIAEPNHDDIDPETLPPKIGAKKLAFASEPLIIYEDGEIEEGIYMDDPDHYVAAVPDEDLKWKTENQSKSSSRASNITKAFRNSFVKVKAEGLLGQNEQRTVDGPFFGILPLTIPSFIIIRKSWAKLKRNDRIHRYHLLPILN